MLIDKLKSDRITAMKDKYDIKKNLLGCVIAEASKKDKTPSDETVISFVKKFIDNAKFNIEKAVADEMKVKLAQEEIKILEEYLPRQISKEELINIFTFCCTDMNVGQKMKYLKDTYPGMYDGKLASDIAKSM